MALIIFSLLDEFRKISTGVLFLLITISNFFHLWTLTTEFFAIYGYSVYPNVFLQCRLNLFIQNVSRGMSTYLCVGIAIDRYLRSDKPHRSRQLCTRRNAFKLALICLILFILLWSFYLLPFSRQDPRTGVCLYDQFPRYHWFLINILLPLRAVCFCLIPILLIVVVNIRMLINIRRSHQRIAEMKENKIATIMRLSTANHSLISSRMSAIDRMLFLLMFANVLTFLVTQIPFHLYGILQVYFQTFDRYTHTLIDVLLLMWSSLYFGIAFYIYCLASPLFRKKFVQIIKKFFRCCD